MILLLVLCVQLSISISGLQEQVRNLAEEEAFLRREIEELRRSQG
jgi:regulator of replication initiation timing